MLLIMTREEAVLRELRLCRAKGDASLNKADNAVIWTD